MDTVLERARLDKACLAAPGVYLPMTAITSL